MRFERYTVRAKRVFTSHAVKHNKQLCYWLVCLVLCGHAVSYAQENMSLRAKQLEGMLLHGEPCKKLVGDVVFTLEKITIHADQAIYYETSARIEAQGSVKIIYKEDGAVILADQLVYKRNSHAAQLRKHVVYQSGTTIFYTDHLDYDMETRQGHFVQGGRLVEGDNVLTSMSGSYNDVDKQAVFHRQVVLTNQNYTLQCDTLYYNTITKIAQFVGSTHITSSDGQYTLKTEEGGEYDTSTQQSTFAQSTIEAASYQLYADLISVDQAKMRYTMTGHVKLVTKKEGMIISGDYGQYKRQQDFAVIYGNALMTQSLGDDTLYLAAEKFITEGIREAHEHPNSVTIRAKKHVKIYKSDFQGKADEMIYKSANSTIYFQGSLVFWSNDIQLTADVAHIVLQHNILHTLHMNDRVCIVTEALPGHYNQLQGKQMVAYFYDNRIDTLKITGNTESIYFLMNDQDQLQGMNHLRCSDITVSMKNNTIAHLTFSYQPTGVFYPLPYIVEGMKQLKNFTWKPSERPTQQDVVKHGYGTNPHYKKFKLPSTR